MTQNPKAIKEKKSNMELTNLGNEKQVSHSWRKKQQIKRAIVVLDWNLEVSL